MRSLFQGNLKGGGTTWCLKKKIGMNGKRATRKKKTGKYSPYSNLFSNGQPAGCSERKKERIRKLIFVNYHFSITNSPPKQATHTKNDRKSLPSSLV